MLLLTCYYPDMLALFYIFGIVSAFIFLFLYEWITAKRAEFGEFREYKKSKRSASEVVDAHFVIKPRTQLNTSQALVRRSTSLERRHRDERQQK